jgi:hypothetical protein
MGFRVWSEERLPWINNAAHVALFKQCFITGLWADFNWNLSLFFHILWNVKNAIVIPQLDIETSPAACRIWRLAQETAWSQSIEAAILKGKPTADNL